MGSQRVRHHQTTNWYYKDHFFPMPFGLDGFCPSQSYQLIWLPHYVLSRETTFNHYLFELLQRDRDLMSFCILETLANPADMFTHLQN